MEFKSPEIHTLPKMEDNSSLNKGQHLNNLHMHLEIDLIPSKTSPLWTKSPKSLVQSTCTFGALGQALGRVAKRLLHERNEDLLINPLLNETKRSIMYIKPRKIINKQLKSHSAKHLAMLFCKMSTMHKTSLNKANY